MCEFCTAHGEGKKWYENAANYTAEVFHKVNSEKNLRKFLGDLSRSLREDVQRAAVWKRRLPRIYNLIAFPLITRHLKKVHFGQIVPVEDVERILDRFSTVVRLPCVCRKASIGREMWKAEYVSAIDPGLCTGCRECMKRCLFGGIRYDRTNVKCTVDPFGCYGCGVCRTVCHAQAISLINRDTSHLISC
jgi:ferredoxin